MISKIWLINLALAILVVFSGIKAADVWFDDDGSVLNSKVSERPAERAPEKKISREAVPPETAYEVVLEDNIFSPNRREYLPPPEPSVEEKPEVVELKIPGKKVVLYGVVLMEGYRKALVTNLEKKGGERDVLWIREGEAYGDFKVSRIEKEKVFLEGNGQEYEIALYGDDKPRRQAVSVPEGKPTVIAPAEDKKGEVAVVSTGGGKTGGSPSVSSSPSEGKSGDDDEYEIVNTPFGKWKRKKK
ncbi:MAG TPA: hypothetical protein PLR43_06500 [Syntrophales bacterium]|nr:hypothetical protein [Syntrophales bacterium]